MTAELADHRLDRLDRAEWLVAAHATEWLDFVQNARQLARLSGVPHQQTRLQRDGLFRTRAGTQAALHAVLFDEPKLWPIRVVGQRAFRTRPDAGKAERARLGVDGQAAERAAARR